MTAPRNVSILGAFGPVGMKLSDFVRRLPISESTYHELPPEHRPKSVRLGGSVIVLESPHEFLQRLAAEQSEQPSLPAVDLAALVGGDAA